MYRGSTYTRTYTYDETLVIKKNEILPMTATWMDLKIFILNETNSGRERQIYDVTNVESKRKKKIQINLLTKQKQTHRQRKQIMVTKGGRWG